jgi:predicted secreted protein
MATHIGRDGILKVGANTVAELRSFSIEETGDTVEDTVMTDTARTFIPTLTSFTGSADVYWDETDATGQGALAVGSSVTIGFYPEGDTVGDTYYTGTALVTGVTRSASFDGMVEASITLQGSGALTESTVA